METAYKIQIFLDKRALGIIQPNNSYGTQNAKDWYISVPFTKSTKLVSDYVQTYSDPFRTTMQRQLVNPYFMEYGFFETIKGFSGATSISVDSSFANITTKARMYNIDINK